MGAQRCLKRTYGAKPAAQLVLAAARLHQPQPPRWRWRMGRDLRQQLNLQIALDCSENANVRACLFYRRLALNRLAAEMSEINRSTFLTIS